MPTIDTGEIIISYAITGDGPETIVLINGLADEKETWMYQTPALVKAGYRVLEFDNRGIGGSSKPQGRYNAAMLANDAKALVNKLGIKQFHLMGVSMGGMIAQAYALEYPTDLLSLTLACTYARPGPFCSRMFKLWEEAAPTMGIHWILRDVTLWAFTQDFFHSRQNELKEMEDIQPSMSVPAYLSQLAVIQDFDTREQLNQLTVPTLVLAGEEDILIPVSLSQELHRLIPHSQWKTVPGGHGCMWEHPDGFNRAFLEFIASQKHGR